MTYKPDKIIKTGFRPASALIMTVVLTVLLAVIGTMFLMMTRVDKMATSAIEQGRNLDAGVGSTIAIISKILVDDVPGLGSSSEYYDYPSNADPWLSNLEPYANVGGSGLESTVFAGSLGGFNMVMADSNDPCSPEDPDYYWRHITNLFDLSPSASAKYIGMQATIVDDYQSTISQGMIADADGDGVADSKWVQLPGISTSKGKPIYAAVRIIDNGAMLNVNTAYEFDSTSAEAIKIDGSSQTQINLIAFGERGTNGGATAMTNRLNEAWFGDEAVDMDDYERDVIWQFAEPNGHYTPFDISDELKLRNRYILNYTKIVTRIEELWENAFDSGLSVPRTSSTALSDDPNYWTGRVNYLVTDPNL